MDSLHQHQRGFNACVIPLHISKRHGLDQVYEAIEGESHTYVQTTLRITTRVKQCARALINLRVSPHVNGSESAS